MLSPTSPQLGGCVWGLWQKKVFSIVHLPRSGYDSHFTHDARRSGVFREVVGRSSSGGVENQWNCVSSGTIVWEGHTVTHELLPEGGKNTWRGSKTEYDDKIWKSFCSADSFLPSYPAPPPPRITVQRLQIGNCVFGYVRSVYLCVFTFALLLYRDWWYAIFFASPLFWCHFRFDVQPRCISLQQGAVSGKTCFVRTDIFIYFCAMEKRFCDVSPRFCIHWPIFWQIEPRRRMLRNPPRDESDLVRLYWKVNTF